MSLTPINGFMASDFAALKSRQSSGGVTQAAFSVPAVTSPAQAATPAVPAASSGQDAPASQRVAFDSSTQAIARLAGDGITFLTLDYNPLAAQIAGLPGPPAAETIVPVDGSVSKAEFERMVAQFGGSGAAADQLFATFDTNNDGSISHGEFLAGLAKVNDDGGNTAFAQTLGELMDDHGNHNGTVDSIEFGAFDAAFVNAEKLAAANDEAPPKPDLTT